MYCLIVMASQWKSDPAIINYIYWNEEMFMFCSFRLHQSWCFTKRADYMNVCVFQHLLWVRVKACTQCTTVHIGHTYRMHCYIQYIYKASSVVTFNVPNLQPQVTGSLLPSITYKWTMWFLSEAATVARILDYLQTVEVCVDGGWFKQPHLARVRVRLDSGECGCTHG